jgi:rhodanese-related sulfurtransferase
LSAGSFLERLGFANVHSLTGGIDAWSCEVDPTVPRY